MHRHSVRPESFRPCLDIPKHVQGIRFGASVGKSSFPDPIFGHRAAARNAFMRQVPFGALSALSFGPADLLSSPGSRHHKHDARLRRRSGGRFHGDGRFQESRIGRSAPIGNSRQAFGFAFAATPDSGCPVGVQAATTAAALPSAIGRYNPQCLRQRPPFTCPAQDMRSFGWPIQPSRSRGQPILDQHLKANHLLPQAKR